MILRTKTTDPEQLPLGCSKMWGGPDLPEDLSFPLFRDEDGELYHYRFICQIDCREAAAFDPQGLLPTAGILYFFARIGYYFTESFDDEPRRAGWWSPSETRVIYVPHNDTSRLAEAVLLDDDNNPLAPADERIEFGAEDGTSAHRLLGETDPAIRTEPGERLLLQLQSCTAGTEALDFGPGVSLCLFIREEDLARQEFGRVRGYLAVPR